jgi:hypothetical protein
MISVVAAVAARPNSELEPVLSRVRLELALLRRPENVEIHREFLATKELLPAEIVKANCG